MSATWGDHWRHLLQSLLPQRQVNQSPGNIRQILFHVGDIVTAGRRIKQMDSRQMSLIVADGQNTAHAADIGARQR